MNKFICKHITMIKAIVMIILAAVVVVYVLTR